MLGRDGFAGLAILAASVVLYTLTLGLKGNPLVPIGPGFYPRIVLGVTAALGLLLVVSDLLARRKRAAPPAAAVGPRPNYAAVAIHFALFGLYVAMLPGLGFRTATFAYVAVANALMDPPRNAKQWARALLLGLLTAFMTWFIFERELSVLLPRGRWTGF